MRINVIDLSFEVDIYTNLIQKYEETVLNIYNSFSNISNTWKSEKASLFFDDIYIEKKNINVTLNELKDIKRIYKYLISKYENFGDEIEILLDNKNEILNSYNKYLSSLEQVLNKFRNLNLSSEISEKSRILNCKDKVKKLIEKVRMLKVAIIKDFNKIEEIEKEVKSRINNLSINLFQEKDINGYSLGVNSANIQFDIEKMEVEISKINILFGEESSFFDDFNSSLNSINKCYSSDNKKLIDNKRIELKKVFKLVNSEHRKDEKFLNDEIAFFKSLPSYLLNNLNNVGGDKFG